MGPVFITELSPACPTVRMTDWCSDFQNLPQNPIQQYSMATFEYRSNGLTSNREEPLGKFKSDQLYISHRLELLFLGFKAILGF
jgi:hypothetical protein